MNSASVLALAMTLIANVALAQTNTVQMPQPTPPSPSAYAPQCSDFKLNPDGSWSPLRAITVGDVTISQKAAFLPGSKIGDVDLATLLNEQCVRR